MCGMLSMGLAGKEISLDGKGRRRDELAAADGTTPRFLQALSFFKDEAAFAADGRGNGQVQFLPVQLDMLQVAVNVPFADTQLLGNLPRRQFIMLQKEDNGMTCGFMLPRRDKGLFPLRLFSDPESPAFPEKSAAPNRPVP